MTWTSDDPDRENSDHSDSDETNDDWEWDPTMRAGANGPEIEPDDCEQYHNKENQRNNP